MKVFFFILCCPLLFQAQIEDNKLIDDLFYEDENGLIFTSDLFKDQYYYEQELIPENLKQKISIYLLSHQEFVDSQEQASESLIKSYIELMYLSGIESSNTLRYSEKIYDLISEDRKYQIHLFDVIRDIVFNYNSIGQENLSAEILEDKNEILENHKNFTCGTGAKVHYNQLGIMFFDTFKKLNKVEIQFQYGFKYLLDNKVYSEKLVKLLIENFDKEILNNAFVNLEKSYVREPVASDSYFKFLNYKIGVNGYSGIFNYYNNYRETTDFEQLKNIWFYKYLANYLSK